MDKKEIQRKRMMSYFIEAANQIIEQEGLEGVTIRKISDIAGYNSATLYNYFENLDHLIFFASMKYLKEYVLALPSYIKDCKNSIDKYLCIWKCFCHFSFKRPKIYYTIFFNKFSDLIEDAIKKYYSIFPEELGDKSDDLLPMLLKSNIYERNISLLENCVSEGLIKNEDIEEINEMNLLIYQGMLVKIMNKQVDYSIEEATNRIIQYFIQTLKAYTNHDIKIPS